MGLGIKHGALNGVPAFQDCLFPLFPLGMDRGYDNERFNVEVKCALVVKVDGNSETFGCVNNFHEANDFVSDFGEVCDFDSPCGFVGRVGILYVSQFAPPCAIWLGVHLRCNAGASRSQLMAVVSGWQGNSYLPKNSGTCPKSAGISGVFGQSPAD